MNDALKMEPLAGEKTPNSVGRKKRCEGDSIKSVENENRTDDGVGGNLEAGLWHRKTIEKAAEDDDHTDSGGLEEASTANFVHQKETRVEPRTST